MTARVIGTLAFLFSVAGMASSAQAAGWCAVYDTSTYNCGFHSYQQCLETIRGVGGYCQPNHLEASRRHR